MSEGDYTDENIMKRWEKELKTEKEKKGGGRMGLDHLKGEIRELEFKIERLLLVGKNINKKINKKEKKITEPVRKSEDKILASIEKEFEELEKEKEEKLLVLCKKEIEGLEEAKRAKKKN